VGGLAGVFHYLGRGKERAAFLSSCAFLIGVLAAAMAGSYPVWLRSTLDRADDLTSTNTASGNYALRAGLAWFVVGVSLAAAYFAFVFRTFRGKIALDEEGHSQ
jgi:cytochrome d ubiquinol oxidase subunit II